MSLFIWKRDAAHQSERTKCEVFLFFRKHILLGQRFCNRLYIGSNRRLYVCRLFCLYRAGPYQFVISEVVEGGFRGIFVVTGRARGSRESIPLSSRVRAEDSERNPRSHRGIVRLSSTPMGRISSKPSTPASWAAFLKLISVVS